MIAAFDLSMRHNYKVGTVPLLSIFYSFNRHLLGLLCMKFRSVYSCLVNKTYTSHPWKPEWGGEQTKMSMDRWWGEWLLDQSSPVVLHSAEYH